MKSRIEGLRIDWVKSYSMLPSKAAIFNSEGNIIKEIPYELGIKIEETLKASLDELEVSAFTEEMENELYIEYSATRKGGECVYAIAQEYKPIERKKSISD